MANLKEFGKVGTLAQIEEGLEASQHRPYLGMSGIGHSCPRYLWFSFRWAFTEYFSKRQLRLFGRGHKEEPFIIKDLERIGIRVSGEQSECEAAWGHCKGHCDGRAKNVPEAPKTEHVAEFKTMNDKSFKDTVKKGVKVSKPGYYAQVQAYMKGLKLTRALFVAVNKNDDSYYVERIPLDKGFADDLYRKAETIVLSTVPDENPFPPNWYECRWCSAKEICESRELDKNCRTCQHIELAPGGTWQCDAKEVGLSVETQRVGCELYEMIII